MLKSSDSELFTYGGNYVVAKIYLQQFLGRSDLADPIVSSRINNVGVAT